MRSRTPDAPSRTTRVLDGGLVVVAAIGLLVLLARLAGALLGLQVVEFATGSMSPAYPQGALAITQRTPLASVRVGDVVTIDRPGRLPITHRVIAVALERGDAATVRLQGDANRHPDPAPYRVTALSRVVAGVPAAFSFLSAAATPPMMLTAAVLAALAVCWALWPRRRSALQPTTT